MNEGKLQVYTGTGKGKTTAALGLAFRASGHGFKTALLCFMKGNIEYGELKAARDNEFIDVFQLGRETFVDKENPDPEDVRLAEKGFEKAEEIIDSNAYDIVVLDEINVVLDFKLLEIPEVMRLIRKRGEGTELVCTGRGAPEEIKNEADLVTEVRELKHYYSEDGTESRKGIEY